MGDVHNQPLISSFQTIVGCYFVRAKITNFFCPHIFCFVFFCLDVADGERCEKAFDKVQ